jgi:peptidoglycan/LPS O-acetylase OafA/YrhL
MAKDLPRRPRLAELDGLRGFAILLVLIWHYVISTVRAMPGTPTAHWLALGRLTWSGVDLFFVLSGFLLGGILLDERESPDCLRVFYARRFFRIVPLYAVLVLAFYGSPFHNRWLTENAAPWYVYASFTQNFWMTHSGTHGANVLGVTWSLAVEEQFYLLLPWIVRCISVRRLPLFLIFCILAAPLTRVLLHASHTHAAMGAYVLMPCRMDSLMLGVLAAWTSRYYRPACQIRIWIVTAAVGLFWMLVATFRNWGIGSLAMDTVGYTLVAIFYTSILLIAVERKPPILRYRPLTELGVIAYGVYLLHQTVQGINFGGAPSIRLPEDWVRMFMSLAITLLVARLSWICFESRLVRFGHRLSYGGPVGDQSIPKVSTPTAEGHLSERARRGDRGKFERAMANVADVEPEQEDRI